MASPVEDVRAANEHLRSVSRVLSTPTQHFGDARSTTHPSMVPADDRGLDTETSDTETSDTETSDPETSDPEQLPVPPHLLHGPGHFLGLYASEHTAATEFVIGATFVALGASFSDIVFGLLIGNTLAVLSFWLIAAPIATRTRLSLYTYIERCMGQFTSRLYNVANVIFFTAISALMITVSATALQVLINIPPQLKGYPTDIRFVILAMSLSVIAVTVAYFGFNVLSDFARICGPWLLVMFTVGGIVMLPALSESLTNQTSLSSLSDFERLAGSGIFSGANARGEPGIGLWEMIGFAWAANAFAHFGLVDMAILRYARKSTYGLCTASGMLCGHYVAWISAAIMGAATAKALRVDIAVVSPGDVATHALGVTGFVVIVVAGWTSANANLYRAGLAAQAVFPRSSRRSVTLAVGVAVAVGSCFPFIYRSILPLLTYAGLVLVPIGGIVFAEQHLFFRIGLKTNWFRMSGLTENIPALSSWILSLTAAAVLGVTDLVPFFYLFLPTWLVSIASYTLLAKWHGADKNHPEAALREWKTERRVMEYHARLADQEPKSRDTGLSWGTLVIRATWIAIGLSWPVSIAVTVLFQSPDLDVYFRNRERFHALAIACTVVYFVFAWWDLQRANARPAKARGRPSTRPVLDLTSDVAPVHLLIPPISASWPPPDPARRAT